MNITIFPGKLAGNVAAIPSKSHAHRLLVCAAFADSTTKLRCKETNRDIEATASCLQALGAVITKTPDSYTVIPVSSIPLSATLDCGESGSTLRFLLPIVGALGVDATFKMSGRLPYRPLSPLWEEMERMGCTLTRPTEDTLRCTGKLQPGCYQMAGNVSSQFISGLLFAMMLIPGNSNLVITEKVESQPYINMTKGALTLFGVETDSYHICGGDRLKTPGEIIVEGDWSNAAFFLAAQALGSDLHIGGLNPGSLQGDRAVVQHLSNLSRNICIDSADIPDLVPILAVVAGCNKGATFQNISRLRLKESDRVASVVAMLENLGAKTTATEHELTVSPAIYGSCTIDAAGDHRIAMAAAIAATVASGPVTILGADCVSKSYPDFWNQYTRLGGRYEQHLR